MVIYACVISGTKAEVYLHVWMQLARFAKPPAVKRAVQSPKNGSPQKRELKIIGLILNSFPWYQTNIVEMISTIKHSWQLVSTVAGKLLAARWKLLWHKVFIAIRSWQWNPSVQENATGCSCKKTTCTFKQLSGLFSRHQVKQVKQENKLLLFI